VLVETSCRVFVKDVLLTLVVPSTRVLPRETIERCVPGPVLTGETEVNGDSKSTNERGLSLVGSLDSPRRVGARDFSFALTTLDGPVQNIKAGQS
jgi:hypothetical protein